MDGHISQHSVWKGKEMDLIQKLECGLMIYLIVMCRQMSIEAKPVSTGAS
jgi:hypothetical protein